MNSEQLKHKVFIYRLQQLSRVAEKLGASIGPLAESMSKIPAAFKEAAKAK